MKKTTQKKSFEDSLHRLEEIVDKLEKGEVPLEKAIDMYEEGINLSVECMGTLTKAELRIQKLTKSINGKIELSEFEVPEQ
jgi:exodeoxyribonuclease VII small subunit